MKAKFKIKANGETSMQVEVVINTLKYVLTRGEVRALKHRMQNRIYDALRETGYDVAEIKIV